MNEIEEIKKLLANISNRLDNMSQQEKQFDLDVCIYFENLSWETYKMSNNLNELQTICGG